MRASTSLLWASLALIAGAALSQCGGTEGFASGGLPPAAGGGGTGPASSSGTGGGGEGGLGLVVPDAGGAGGQAGGAGAEPDAGPGPACGDGKIDPGEKCDDGNAESSDGCSGNCDAIEMGWACPQPGQPCVWTVVCGDGKVSGDETCDDQNAKPADGCDQKCHVELGWKCPVLGAACVAAACGDGMLAGTEKCDDGNGNGSDGCSADCKLEAGFKCPVPALPCEKTTCGDGKAEGTEQCDDGDHDLGDGCTPFCVNEPDCKGGPCTSSCGDGIMLPGGSEQCEDGNTAGGDGCSADCKIEPGYVCPQVQEDPATLLLPIVIRDFKKTHPDFEHPCCAFDPGIVTASLGPDGKPVYAGQGGNPMTTGQANFDQWYRDTPGVNFPIVQTLALAKLQSGVYQYSSSAFFPIDGQGFGNDGYGHNFHFTSEVRYWFEYKGGEQLDFTGDDDVWVFVNKSLAVDLGGVHGAMSGSVTLDANAAAKFALAVGKIYEIAVFQAERHTTESNYKLTLSKFVNSLSHCQSVCGDGIKTPDEACDDGVNDGSYGKCTPNCQWGPYCGDAVLQPQYEECDDGVNLSPYGGCAPGCVKGGYCGDGQVDGLFGEKCDDGVNDGGYGECAPGCVLGPRCGDAVVQPEHEQCDDGNKKNGDGCDVACHDESPH